MTDDTRTDSGADAFPEDALPLEEWERDAAADARRSVVVRFRATLSSAECSRALEEAGSTVTSAGAGVYVVEVTPAALGRVRALTGFLDVSPPTPYLFGEGGSSVSGGFH